MSMLDEIISAFDIKDDVNDKSETINEDEVKTKSAKMIADKVDVVTEDNDNEDAEQEEDG